MAEFRNTMQFTKYVHAQDEELSNFWPPEAEQQKVYHYAFYEVALDAEIDLDTGKARIIGVEGVPLEAPVSA